MKDYELINAIKNVVDTDGKLLTDGECLDRIIELVQEYEAFNFVGEGA